MSTNSANVITSHEIERFLYVGQPAQIDTNMLNPNSERLPIEIVGWLKPKFIVACTARNYQGMSKVIPAQRSVARFVNEGRPCAFKAEVVGERVDRAEPFFLMKWPEEIRYTIIRNVNRQKVNFPCEVTLEDGMVLPAETKDLSLSGIRLYIPMLLEEGTLFKCTMHFPNGVVIPEVECKVCHRILTAEGVVAGCQFTSLQQEAFDKISFYLDCLAMGTPTTRDVLDQVILVSEDKVENFQILKEAMEEHHILLRENNDIVQAFAWIGMSHPKALLYNQANSTISSDLFCACIRNSSFAAQTRFITYGGSGACTNADGHIDNLKDHARLAALLNEAAKAE